MKRKLHIIEPQLRNMRGHYIKYVIDLSKVAMQNNYEIICWINASATNETFRLLLENGIRVNAVFADDFRIFKYVRILRWIWQSILYWHVLKKIHNKNQKADIVLTFTGELEYLIGAIFFHLFNTNSMPLFIQLFRWEVREKESNMKPLIVGIRRLTEIISKKKIS